MPNVLRLLITLTTVVWILMPPPARSASKRLKVFTFAGQSNMDGPAAADRDGKNDNHGKGTLNPLLADPSRAEGFRHLRGGADPWVQAPDEGRKLRQEPGKRETGKLGFRSPGLPGSWGQRGHPE